MVTLIARKRIYKTRAGELLRVSPMEARVLKALNLAYDAPTAPKPVEYLPKIPAPVPKRREYLRRDMVAEAPLVAESPTTLPRVDD